MRNLMVLATLGRVLLAALFILSGIGKIAAPGMTQSYIADAGLPLPLLVYLSAVVIEIGGGALLVLGYRVRLAALMLAAFTLAAAIGFHLRFSDPNQIVHFLKNIAIIGGLFQVAAFGSGDLSLDSRASGNR